MNVIVHFDEIFLKGKNQGMFVKKLAENIRRLFKGVTVRRIEGGLILDKFASVDLERLGLVPGIARYAEAVVCPRAYAKIEQTALALKPPDNVISFRIMAARSDKSYELNSEELCKRLGAEVVKATGLKVDLKNPDFVLHVDTTRTQAVIYGNLSYGTGGLPTGTSGKVLCLLSGGIDSPVAAYEMMKRGALVTLVHYQNQTQVTDEVSEKIIDLARILARYQPDVKLIIVPFAGYQKQIIMKIPADSRMILSRRLMFKLSEILAKQERILALVTGDSLGQVASQTLENLHAVYSSTRLLKLSPLIGMNKTDIVKIARKLGTMDVSTRPYEDCCSLFVAKHPKTKASLSAIEKLEQSIDFTGLDKIAPISYHISMN
jgi:tRNA uracil 4-sulfurtransferase